MVDINHHKSVYSQGPLCGVLEIQKLEIVTWEDVLLLFDNVGLAINSLDDFQVLDVAVARLVIASLFKA
jgi:hypothetical protein